MHFSLQSFLTAGLYLIQLCETGCLEMPHVFNWLGQESNIITSTFTTTNFYFLVRKLSSTICRNSRTVSTAGRTFLICHSVWSFHDITVCMTDKWFWNCPTWFRGWFSSLVQAVIITFFLPIWTSSISIQKHLLLSRHCYRRNLSLVWQEMPAMVSFAHLILCWKVTVTALTPTQEHRDTQGHVFSGFH